MFVDGRVDGRQASLFMKGEGDDEDVDVDVDEAGVVGGWVVEKGVCVVLEF